MAFLVASVQRCRDSDIECVYIYIRHNTRGTGITTALQSSQGAVWSRPQFILMLFSTPLVSSWVQPVIGAPTIYPSTMPLYLNSPYLLLPQSPLSLLHSLPTLWMHFSLSLSPSLFLKLYRMAWISSLYPLSVYKYDPGFLVPLRDSHS